MMWLKSLILSLMIATAANGAPFDREQIPSQTKWLLHIDVDAGRDTELWRMFRTVLMSSDSVQRKVADLERATGSRFPEALHGITLYGNSYWPEECVVVVHSTVDRKRIESLLDARKDAGRSHYGSYEVITWKDHDTELFATFTSDNRVVVARTRDSLHASLDVTNRSADPLAMDDLLLQGVEPGLLIYIAGNGLADLSEKNLARSPLIEQTEMGWLALSEKDGIAIIRSRMQAHSSEVTEQLSKAVEGLVAIAALNGSATSRDPTQRAIAVVMRSVKVVTGTNTVDIDWRISLADLRSAVAGSEGQSTGQ